MNKTQSGMNSSKANGTLILRGRKMKRVAIVGCFLFVLVAASRSSSQPELFALRFPLTDRTLISKFVARGFDIMGVDMETNEFVVVTDSVGLKQVKTITRLLPVATYRIEETLDGAYKNPQEVKEFLDKAENDYPHLVHTEVIGTSTDGQEIHAVRVTDSFRTPTRGKTALLFDAMHHAREVMTPEIALDMVEYLTTRYETDAEVRKWLLLNEIWIVPMLNPDGNARVWSNSSMWRKNTRGGYGVDNNRNYPYAWGSCNGSSGSTSDEQYRGPSAGSEPETQALMNLAKRIEPVFNISYHTASEIVIYPLSCPNQRLPAQEKAIVEGIGKELARTLVRDSGSGTYVPGTSYELLYPVDGGSSDWMYEEMRALAYTIEANSTNQGFQPSFSRWRNTTVERNRAGWKYILNRAQSSGIRVRSTPGERVRIETVTGALVFDKKVDSKGWAHFVVNPGQYRVVNVDNRSIPAQTTVVGTGINLVQF
jgi:carboxypeptidase T